MGHPLPIQRVGGEARLSELNSVRNAEPPGVLQNHRL
jgi:hypothetical protein